nr:putative reverse transcriptase domain-containing protein [Tanacetum cinerariifolium]
MVADALSRKERVKIKRVRAMNMTLQSSIKDRILAAQKEAVDESVGLQKGLDEMIEHRSYGTLYYMDRIWRVWIVFPKKKFLQSWLEWDTRSHQQSSHYTKPSSRASGSSLSIPSYSA